MLKNDTIEAHFSLDQHSPEIINSTLASPPQSQIDALNEKSINRASEILKEYTAENTKRAYAGDLKYWEAWLRCVGFAFSNGISIKEIISFVVQHAEGLDPEIDKQLVKEGFKERLGPHKLATIKRRIVALSGFLEAVKWDNPCKSQELRKLLSKLTKRYGRSKPSGKAITKDILKDMIKTCRKKSIIDIRDKALLLFAWGSGGRRRSEVVASDMKDLTPTPGGEFIYTIPSSKTDQEGRGYPVPIKGKVAKALNEWLQVARIKEGPIFRATRRSGKIGGALGDKAVYRIVHKRLKMGGYNERLFCAHSLRSGFVTEAGRRNKPLGDVMALTTHRNVNTVMRYYQAGSIINNSAANLAD